MFLTEAREGYHAEKRIESFAEKCTCNYNWLF